MTKTVFTSGGLEIDQWAPWIFLYQCRKTQNVVYTISTHICVDFKLTGGALETRDQLAINAFPLIFCFRIE